MAERAIGDSVTAEALTDSKEGGLLSSGYPPLVSYLKEDEQPHFLFEFYKGGALDNDLSQYKGKHHHLLVTDYCIRNVSTKVDSTIQYGGVVNAGMESASNGYFLNVETEGQGERSFKLSGNLSSLRKKTDPSELREAAEFIREKARETTMHEATGSTRRTHNSTEPTHRTHDTTESTNGRDESVVEKLAELDEMKERGLITEAEFEDKKNDLLDRM
jgi:hypothetical protein